MAQRALAMVPDLAPSRLDGSLDAVYLGRAKYLAGTALRLLGRLVEAESAILGAERFLAWQHRSLDRAFWCRSLALLRWEQGRLDEAGGLLGRAACSFFAARLEEEAGTTRALLGLLAFEEGERAVASIELRTAKETMDLERRPWLSVRVCLALAIIVAGHRRKAPARTLLREVWRLSPHQVSDPRERIVARWWEGRVQGRLGNHHEAAGLLRTARLKYLEERRVPEAALVTLDVMHLSAEAGRVAEACEAAAELKLWLGREEGAGEALLALESFAGDLATQRDDLRRCTIEKGALIRRWLRCQGFRIDPLPFA
jgi:tetratricopeptide (TPR) repeat protein